MGCCDQKRFLETDNLSENIIRTVLFNLKVKNLTFNTFYHQILDKILQNKDNYYKIVDEFYLYSTEENIYRDAQLYMFPEFSHEYDFKLILLSFTYGFLEKVELTINKDLQKICEGFNNEPNIKSFKKFLRVYLYYNIVYFSQKIFKAYEDGLIKDSKDKKTVCKSFEILLKYTCIKTVSNEIYFEIIEEFENYLKNKDNNDPEKKQVIIDMKLVENDFEVITNKFPWLWNTLELRNYTFNKYKPGTEHIFSNINRVEEGSFLNGISFK